MRVSPAASGWGASYAQSLRWPSHHSSPLHAPATLAFRGPRSIGRQACYHAPLRPSPAALQAAVKQEPSCRPFRPNRCVDLGVAARTCSVPQPTCQRHVCLTVSLARNSNADALPRLTQGTSERRPLPTLTALTAGVPRSALSAGQKHFVCVGWPLTCYSAASTLLAALAAVPPRRTAQT